MEVELGLKITKTKDGVSSISDFQFAKDRAGTIFFSKETDTKFILYAHLKGYKKDNIEIKITEDGKEIWVSGQTAVQEMTIIPLKKEEEKVIRGFIKKFKIPQGVVLDGIKASYEEEEWKLTIVMPKMVKGISEVGIEEVKDEIEEEKNEEDQNDNNSGISKVEGELQSVEEEMKEEEEEKPSDEETKKKRPRKPWKPCPPLLLGGPAFLVTLLFLVIHFIKLKHNK